ncbi:hypothetical protein QBC32DRAFT_329736 [Pseudoneurospora amorphoporcata]|uniref:Protein kinase domain-containing protein n=1 Tax=Pseudoneurospora amorphoporcata TaxID=241081 RepID=A0AAN6P511_9PEZI|nr:hypothetical protein QBC32DRAFT_329736 [Pseudoneurospora amorphoporcata]
MFEPLSIIGLVINCFEIGDKVVAVCSSWINVDSEVRDRSLIIETHWQTTKLQLDFLRRIGSLLNDDLCRLIDELLLQLSQKLTLAESVLKKISKKHSPARSGAWGLVHKAKKASWPWEKESLDQIIDDLDTWHRRFHPLLFMVTKTTSPDVDTALAEAQSASGEKSRARGLPSARKNPLGLATGIRRVLLSSPDQCRPKFFSGGHIETTDILFSEVKAGRLEQDSKWYIIDTVHVGPLQRDRDVLQDVSTLATKLTQADPLTFGLLNCKGVIPVQSQSVASSASSQSSSPSKGRHTYTSFQLILRSPEGMPVLQSLRQLLLNSDEHISLSRKMRIARELAKAIHYVHTFAFVHKNVRPESILCFEDDGASRSHAFLVGFDAFRAAGGGTAMTGDMTWERNVYRHPLRQGLDPAERYRMQHDIYSLGVCLLEIGLWETFVEYIAGGEDDSGRPHAKAGKAYYRFQKWLKEKEKTVTSDTQISTTFGALAFGHKDYLVEQARSRLAPRMGDRYANLVLSCLTCLDDDNEDFGGPDVDDETVAVCFAERILKGLDQISMI